MTVGRKRRDGFTLVELIVSLVILAVLAAILIPSLSGYVDRANRRAVVAECRSAVLAAQTTASELYAQGTFSRSTVQSRITEIQTLAELPAGASITSLAVSDTAVVTKLVYESAGGQYVIYENGTYTVSDTDPAGASAISYYSQSAGLLTTIKTQTPGIGLYAARNALDSGYQAANGGSYPGLSSSEQASLLKASQAYSRSMTSGAIAALTWKPTLLDDGKTIVMRASAGSSNMAYLVYANGQYYYHINAVGQSYTHIDSNSVTGSFNLTDQWIAFTP